MVIRILKWLGVGVVALGALAAVAYALRTNPVGPVAGRALTGEVVTAPISDWSFSDEHDLIAVETRPAAPHSVTTICFTHEGDLYVPASEASRKSWSHYAVSDPRVRVKIGDKIYPVHASRVTDASQTEVLTAAARAKYDFAADGELPEDIWVFRLASAPVDVAAEPQAEPDPGMRQAGLLSLARSIVASVDRSEADLAMDTRRHPIELLAFARVQPAMRVADLGAASGYTTELLARAVGPEGVVYGQNTPAVIEKYVSESWPQRLARPVMGNVVRVDSQLDAPLPGAARLDLITMVFVYHDTLFLDVDRPRMNAALFNALEPGGSLVVVDHRADPGAGEDVGKTLHRIDEALLRRELLGAGFLLAAEADFLANADDPRSQPFFELDQPTDAFVHRYVRPSAE